MRPIPAPRLGDTHGLLRAINQRERLRVDEFITEFSIEELFPPGLENALGRTRQFVSFARSAGLLNEDRGSVSLTEIGKRYVRAGDDEAPFDVAPDQAEWLRRQLRERHMTDSIYHGAAIGLSLYASNPPDFRISMLDFGRALAHLGRAGWDNENTLESQGERYTTFLRDLELIDEERHLTETGTQAKGELTLPIHMSLRDLAGQLNPGGPEGAAADGEAEWAAHAGAVTEEEPTAAEEPEPVAAAEPEEEDEGDEYEDVRGTEPAPAAEPVAEAAPADSAPPAPEPVAEAAPAAPEPAAAPAAEPGRPVPPSDIWETAAPDETTRAYSAIKPEQAAAAAVESSAPAEAPLQGPPAAVEAGDPLHAGAAGTEAGDPPAPDADSVTAGEPSGPPTAEAAAPEPATPEPGDPLAAGDVAAEADAPTPEPGDPLAAGAAASESTGPSGEAAAAAPEPGDPLAAGAPPASDVPSAAGAAAEPGDPLAAGAPLASEVPSPAGAAAEPGDPLAAGAAASASGEAAAAPPESADQPAGAAGAVPDAGEPVAAPAPADVPAPETAAPASSREPSGFLDLASVRAAAEESGLKLPDSVYASLIAALASGKHLVLAGPAGSGKTTLALAIAKAAVQSGRSAGAALATASPAWTARDTVGHVAEGGFTQGHVLAAAGKKKWLLIDEIDRAELDQAFGDLSSFLAGLPLSLPDGSREVAAPSDWRLVATHDSGRGPLQASPALLRRFAQVHLPRPERADLERAIDAAAGDATAAAAVKRLLAADLPGLGAGVFIDAARHAAERHALSATSETELAREVLAAYVAPHLHAEPGRVKEIEDSL